MARLASGQVVAHMQAIVSERSGSSIPRDAGKPGWPAEAKPLPNHLPAPSLVKKLTASHFAFTDQQSAAE